MTRGRDRKCPRQTRPVGPDPTTTNDGDTMDIEHVIDELSCARRPRGSTRHDIEAEGRRDTRSSRRHLDGRCGTTTSRSASCHTSPKSQLRDDEKRYLRVVAWGCPSERSDRRRPISARKTDPDQTVPKIGDRGPRNGPAYRSYEIRTNGPPRVVSTHLSVPGSRLTIDERRNRHVVAVRGGRREREIHELSSGSL